MMMPTTFELLGIDRLSVRERLELIEQIWDSLPEQVSADEIPERHLAELARRRAAAEASLGRGLATGGFPIIS
jgi:putative addiction module component (TIGR02574 family)